MKERPILFSGPMVRAILEGRKTQTRRIIKNQNLVGAPSHGFNAYEVEDSNGNRFWGFSSDDDDWKCPYGKPGDRLWVREAFVHLGEYGQVFYRATGGDNNFGDDLRWPGPWKPSIHMKRKFSRITLEVVSVRVERLQEISENDAHSEGVDQGEHLDAPEGCYSFTEGFRRVWNKINGPGSWDDNQWVWVIEFRMVGSE